jgi:iron complex transport system substrate-binding protein
VAPGESGTYGTPATVTAMRVVSLLPAATETLSALGVEPVGVSAACDYPPPVREVPAVTRSRVAGEGASADVNEAVADAVDAGGVFDLDRETLRAVDPDLVVTQGVCDVCAVDDGVVREAVAEMGLDAEVLSTHAHTLDGAFTEMEHIGAAVDRAERARDLVADFRARIEAVAERTPPERPRTLLVEWLDPVVVAGHWGPELVARAGGEAGLAAAGDPSEPREWAAVREYDPEVIVAAPCGFGVEQTLANAAELTGRPGWADLAAVRAGEVYALDGHHLVNRPGPRLVESVEHLAGLVHPGTLDSPPRSIARPLDP